MSGSVLALIGASIVCAPPARAQTSYSALYAFGTSLSDTGNVFAMTAAGTGTAQPAAPYSEGRYTNGPVWVQHLAALLGIGPVTASLTGGTDYAIGGAQTDAIASGSAIATDLQSQLASFRAAHPTAPADALYTLDIGSNDVLAVLDVFETTPGVTSEEATKAVDAAAASAARFVASLHAMGAQRLVVVGLPDLGKLPEVSSNAQVADAATYGAARFNAAFAADVAATQAAGMQIDILDEYGSWNAIFARPAAYGFNDVTTPCYTGTGFVGGTSAGGGLCAATVSQQDKHFFFDSLHPTEAAAALIARDAYAVLTAAPCAVATTGN